MGITYPPELLPIASPDDDAEVICMGRPVVITGITDGQCGAANRYGDTERGGYVLISGLMISDGDCA